MKSPAIIVYLCVSPVRSISYCFIYFEALLVDVYTFSIVMSFCHIFPFIIIRLFACKFSLLQILLFSYLPL